MSEELRLSKRMSQLNMCSRREADEWILKGYVKVDGQVVNTLGTKIFPHQKITIDKRAKKEQLDRVTILMNKPLGFVSGQAEDGYKPALVLVLPENHWSEDKTKKMFQKTQLKSLVPAGRLDINSTGLLVLTQDGRMAKQLIGEDSDIEKEYLVRVRYTKEGSFPKESLQLLRHGLSLDGKALQKAKVDWVNENQLRFILKEGKKRQIRRMCEAVGLKVLALKRTRIGRIKLGRLPVGKWRYLQNEEAF